MHFLFSELSFWSSALPVSLWNLKHLPPHSLQKLDHRHLKHLTSICTWQANFPTLFHRNVIKSVNIVMGHIRTSEQQQQQKTVRPERGYERVGWDEARGAGRASARTHRGNAHLRISARGHPNPPSQAPTADACRPPPPSKGRVPGSADFPGTQATAHRSLSNHPVGGNGPSRRLTPEQQEQQGQM